MLGNEQAKTGEIRASLNRPEKTPPRRRRNDLSRGTGRRLRMGVFREFQEVALQCRRDQFGRVGRTRFLGQGQHLQLVAAHALDRPACFRLVAEIAEHERGAETVAPDDVFGQEVLQDDQFRITGRSGLRPARPYLRDRLAVEDLLMLDNPSAGRQPQRTNRIGIAQGGKLRRRSDETFHRPDDLILRGPPRDVPDLVRNSPKGFGRPDVELALRGVANEWLGVSRAGCKGRDGRRQNEKTGA